MAKKSYLYFKLGEKATTFVDPKSGLSLVNQQVQRVNKGKANSSKRLGEAVKGGHIEEVEEDEFNEYVNGLPKDEKKAYLGESKPGEGEGAEGKSDEGEEDAAAKKKAEKRAAKANKNK